MHIHLVKQKGGLSSEAQALQLPMNREAKCHRRSVMRDTIQRKPALGALDVKFEANTSAFRTPTSTHRRRTVDFHQVNMVFGKHGFVKTDTTTVDVAKISPPREIPTPLSKAARRAKRRRLSSYDKAHEELLNTHSHPSLHEKSPVSSKRPLASYNSMDEVVKEEEEGEYDESMLFQMDE